jgi:aryl-alcohol dehydrogenase-like predicted oxidoreductase
VEAPLGERRQLGWTDLRVAPLAVGTMQLGWALSDVHSMDLLDVYVEAGGNFIDSADMYGPDQTRRSWAAARPHVGVAEEIIGRWMHHRKNRDQLVVATKARAWVWDGPDGAGLSAKHLTRALDDSLRRLRVETIDLYQAHWPDDEVPVEETFGFFEEMVKAGKIRYVGTSNYAGMGRLEEVLALSKQPGYPRLASEQPRYNLVNRGEFEGGLQRIALQEQIGVICYSPLGSGFLSGKYRRGAPVPSSHRGGFVSQYFNERGWLLIDTLEEVGRNHGASVPAVALAWMLAQPGITAPIVGASSTQQLEQWLPAARLQLEPDELSRLSEAGWWESAIEFSGSWV